MSTEEFKNTDYHVKNEDKVDESQKSQYKYGSEVLPATWQK